MISAALRMFPTTTATAPTNWLLLAASFDVSAAFPSSPSLPSSAVSFFSSSALSAASLNLSSAFSKSSFSTACFFSPFSSVTSTFSGICLLVIAVLLAGIVYFFYNANMEKNKSSALRHVFYCFKQGNLYISNLLA